MSLNKQTLNINFAQGLDLKTDPLQVQPGKFLALSNCVFTKGGRLQKRNGYGALATLPDTTSTYCTTFSDNLTAIGNSLQAYSLGSNSWVNKGAIYPTQLDVLPLIRSNTNQSQADSVVASNGFVCTVFTDNVPDGLGSTTPTYKYVVADSTTGQNITSPQVIPIASGLITNAPKVFLLGNYFMIVFDNVVAAVNRLQYVAVSVTNPTVVSANTDISSQYTPSSTGNFDGVVINNILYIAWNGNDGGGAIRMSKINSSLTQSNTVSFATRVATLMSVTADATTSSPIIYASFYNLGTTTGYTLAVDQNLVTVLAPTQTIPSGTVLNITSAAQNGICTVFYEVSNAYSYDSSIKSNFIKSRTITQGGSLGTAATVIRSVGLASKAFIIDSIEYFLTAYSSTNQPSYFLVSSTGQIVAKLAYQNGFGYYTKGLPNVTVTESVAQMPYLVKDLVQGVNKTQGLANPNGIYAQTGINLASFDILTSDIGTSEIGNDLHITGGFLWMYDGYLPVEHGFFLYPDNVENTATTTGGSLTAQQYYYSVTYEWSDNQGNLFRSAPSIPLSVNISGSGTATNTNTLHIPTLRLTYKTANPVKIVVYRWSTAQQIYYQVSSISVPTLNSTTTDSIDFVDTFADATILGNNILYTTGGVLENISAPAFSNIALFQSRLFGIDAEDKNLLWFSKQVIENTPVEMSDLLTIFVAPTTSAQGNTGPMLALSAMDDKAIIFKKNAIYYTTGTGPDNTGANNGYSEPVFITSTVGCDNQKSIVFIPNGLMFQSDKGIWLLGRDLSTRYIGAAVEDFNDSVVLSAVNVPGTNQVRFTLDNGVTLMYDYYFDKWGTFLNVPAISSTLYQNLHTYINSFGQVFQETPGLYIDGSKPVVMAFKTSWLNLAGLQGYERAYYFYILGLYASPHKLNVEIAYDYNSSPTQSSIITPTNYTTPWGGEQLWGSSGPWGGEGSLEQWRVFLKQQKCQAFQITISEMFDPSYHTVSGAGLTFSGLDLVVGMKSGYPRIKSSKSVG